METERKELSVAQLKSYYLDYRLNQISLQQFETTISFLVNF